MDFLEINKYYNNLNPENNGKNSKNSSNRIVCDGSTGN